MIFHQADSLSLSVFVLFSLIMLGIVLFSLKKIKASKKYFLSVVGYLIIFSALVLSGTVKEHVIPLVPLLFLSVIVCSSLLAMSTAGRSLSQIYPLAFLVGFQGFRLFLELILHHWVNIGTIPSTMTWRGQNWDIAAGLISIFAIPFVNKNIKLAWFTQVLGLILLLNVLRVVVLSSPFPFSWAMENPLQLIMYFPYALIGPLFVGAALCVHLITIRKLKTISVLK
jgi:hypothetical protein